MKVSLKVLLIVTPAPPAPVAQRIEQRFPKGKPPTLSEMAWSGLRWSSVRPSHEEQQPTTTTNSGTASVINERESARCSSLSRLYAFSLFSASRI